MAVPIVLCEWRLLFAVAFGDKVLNSNVWILKDRERWSMKWIQWIVMMDWWKLGGRKEEAWHRGVLWILNGTEDRGSITSGYCDLVCN